LLTQLTPPRDAQQSWVEGSHVLLPQTTDVGEPVAASVGVDASLAPPPPDVALLDPPPAVAWEELCSLPDELLLDSSPLTPAVV
jgi:hypothetical protein